MKQIPRLVLFAALLALLCVPSRAENFKLKPNDIGELIDGLAALDGYEHSIDQGPGNPARIVPREPYKLTRETRAKLGANRAALIRAAKDLQEKLSEIRLKISGDPEKIDDKDPAQMKLWKQQTAKLNEAVEIDLSPITADELTVNDNPIPISVLSVLNRLRPPPTTAVAAAK